MVLLRGSLPNSKKPRFMHFKNHNNKSKNIPTSVINTGRGSTEPNKIGLILKTSIKISSIKKLSLCCRVADAGA